MDIEQLPGIETRIQVMRGIKVMVDADLAALYGVTTRRLNEQVKRKRNRARFPGDFMFQLSQAEKAQVVANCDHLRKLKFSKSLPHAFTEHGANQGANVLASPQAIEMGIHVVRAFVCMRALAATHDDLARRLAALEHKAETLALHHDQLQHDTHTQLQHDTHTQLRQVFDALRALMTPSPEPVKRPIGFVAPGEAGRKGPTS